MVNDALAAAGAKVFHAKKIVAALKKHNTAAAAAEAGVVAAGGSVNGTSTWHKSWAAASPNNREAATEDDLVATMVGLEAVSDFCVAADLQKIATAKKDKDPALWTVRVAKAFGVHLRKIAGNNE